jgi:hypothetical protein
MKMRSAILVLSLVLVASVAHAGTYFRYADDNGALAFTDNAERIPSEFRDAADTVELPPLTSYAKYTPVPATVVPKITPRSLPARASEGCGPVTFRTERRQDGDYNRRYYTVEDDCGVLFDAPYYPELQSNR